MIRMSARAINIDGLDLQFEEIVGILEENLDAVATLIHHEAENTVAFVDRKKRLRPSIKKRKSKFVGGGFIIVASGRGKDRGNHAHLVEFGHVMLSHAGAPTKLRRVPAHPFMRPAAEKGIQKAIELFRVKKR